MSYDDDSDDENETNTIEANQSDNRSELQAKLIKDTDVVTNSANSKLQVAIQPGSVDSQTFGQRTASLNKAQQEYVESGQAYDNE